MQRKLVFLRSEHGVQPGKINIYIDATLTYPLMKYVGADKARMRRVDKNFEYISRGIETNEVFRKEKFEAGIEVWAIRIIVRGKGEKYNDRFYCKLYEIDNVKHIVIGYILENKKTDHLTEKLRNIIREVNSYEYEFEEE